MPSLKISAAVIATALFVTARGQAQYTIDPDSVPLSTRTSWCQSQVASCPLLCLQLSGDSSTTEADDCDPNTLTYDCICGNGLSPNSSEYSQTLPFYICQEYGNQCVAACNGSTTCQNDCRVDNPCGAQDPTRVNTTTTSSAAASSTASSTSGGVVYNGLGNTATTTSSSSKSGAQAALDMGRSYGLGVVAAAIFAGFALVM